MDDTSSHNPRFCLRCGYSLHGLGRNQCPECGRLFDPRNPLTTAAHPVRDARILLARAGRTLTIAVGIAAGAASLASAARVDLLLRWCAGILLAPFLIVLVIAVLSRSVPLSPGWRKAGLACAAALVTIVVLDWPFRLVFELHRPALNRIAARVRSGELSPDSGPVTVGVFTFQRVRAAPNGNLGFQLSGGAGGGEYLVHQQQPGTWIWFNTNWEQHLCGGWFRVQED